MFTVCYPLFSRPSSPLVIYSPFLVSIFFPPPPPPASKCCSDPPEALWSAPRIDSSAADIYEILPRDQERMERCIPWFLFPEPWQTAHTKPPVDAGASAHLTDGHGGEVARYSGVSGFGTWGRFLVVPSLGSTGGPRSTALISQSAIVAILPCGV